MKSPPTPRRTAGPDRSFCTTRPFFVLEPRRAQLTRWSGIQPSRNRGRYQQNSRPLFRIRPAKIACFGKGVDQAGAIDESIDLFINDTDHSSWASRPERPDAPPPYLF